MRKRIPLEFLIQDTPKPLSRCHDPCLHQGLLISKELKEPADFQRDSYGKQTIDSKTLNLILARPCKDRVRRRHLFIDQPRRSGDLILYPILIMKPDP